jgi:hypothetical protein
MQKEEKKCKRRSIEKQLKHLKKIWRERKNKMIIYNKKIFSLSIPIEKKI